MKITKIVKNTSQNTQMIKERALDGGRSILQHDKRTRKTFK